MQFLIQHRKCLILMVLIICCGCGQAVTRVSIPVKVQSELDMNRYSNFAVLPFWAVELKDNEVQPSMTMGEEVASMMRRALGRHKNLDVTRAQETERLLTGETINLDVLEDMNELVRIGQYFEVDAVITGTYKFYTISQPRRQYGERYSPTLQRYVTDYQDYLQKTYVLLLQITIIDMEKEETVWNEQYERSAIEPHTFGSFLVSRVTPQDTVLKNLAKQAISEFTRRIAPHYEEEERFLVR